MVPHGAKVADGPRGELTILEKRAETMQVAGAEKAQAFVGQDEGSSGKVHDFVVETAK